MDSLDQETRQALTDISDYFSRVELKENSVKQAATEWKDSELGALTDYSVPKLELEELTPFYVAYADLITGCPITTAPVGEIIKVLVGYIPKKDLTGLIFDMCRTGTKPTMSWKSSNYTPAQPAQGDDSNLGVHSDPTTSRESRPVSFSEKVTRMLQDDDLSASIRALLSFHALISLRVSIKTITSVKRALDERCVGLAKNLFSNLKINENPPPMSERFLEAIKSSFDKGSDEGVRMFRMILCLYRDKQESRDICSILEAGVLRHTQGNGLGIITLLFNAAGQYQKTVAQMTQFLVSNHTLESVNRIKRFAELYLYKQSKEVTWWWCRIVDDSQWTSLKISNNAVVSARLASLLIEHNPEIFINVELSKLSEVLKRQGAKWAMAFKKELELEMQSEVGPGVSGRILAKAKALPSAAPSLGDFGDLGDD